ncbi:MAG TPA: hypothetical protein VG758_18915, partial [Hyphomicrobiaceae bacterium]|nr:hypothetical protein [Hyphomicrobiaceae bacterium]
VRKRSLGLGLRAPQFLTWGGEVVRLAAQALGMGLLAGTGQRSSHGIVGVQALGLTMARPCGKPRRQPKT